MSEFETVLIRDRVRCGLELLAIAGDSSQDEDGLDPDEKVHLNVTVEYNPEWSKPGNLSGLPEDCYPAEGEGLEITGVMVGWPEVDIMSTLSEEELHVLMLRAEEDQEDEYYDEGDYEDSGYYEDDDSGY